MTIKIKTNHQVRELITVSDLPLAARSDFDYVDDPYGDMTIFKYKGSYYGLGEFVKIYNRGDVAPPFAHQTDDEEILKWDGIATQSAFDAVLIRLVEDRSDDSGVIVGYASW